MDSEGSAETFPAPVALLHTELAFELKYVLLITLDVVTMAAVRDQALFIICVCIEQISCLVQPRLEDEYPRKSSKKQLEYNISVSKYTYCLQPWQLC